MNERLENEISALFNSFSLTSPITFCLNYRIKKNVCKHAHMAINIPASKIPILFSIFYFILSLCVSVSRSLSFYRIYFRHEIENEIFYFQRAHFLSFNLKSKNNHTRHQDQKGRRYGEKPFAFKSCLFQLSCKMVFSVCIYELMTADHPHETAFYVQ